jgi:hypothetical protein
MRALPIKCAALALAAYSLACSDAGAPANGAGSAGGSAPVVTAGVGGVPAASGSASSAGADSAGPAGGGGNAGNGVAGSSAGGQVASGGSTGFAGAGTGGGAAGGAGGGAPDGAKGKATLVITGKGQPTPGDLVMIERIKAYGFEPVVTITDALANADAVMGSALVVISSSAESAPLDDRLKDIPIPVLCIEDAEFTKMGMASSGDHDAGITQLVISPGAGALVGNVTGTITISTKAGELGWATPAPAALIGATMPGAAGHAVVFGYDQGAQMATMTAPARRAGVAIREGLAANLNADGLKLFDAILAWVSK